MDTLSESMSPAARPGASRACGQLGGKYMTFKLAREEYGLEILKVLEIIRLMEITPAPQMREYFRGIINLRGKVIPVIDLRLKLGMDRADATDQSVIIVVQCAAGRRTLTMGVLVDQVLEVLSIDAAQIEPPPSFGQSADDIDFVLGIGKADDRVIFLIDIGRLLSPDEADDVVQSSTSSL